MDHAVASMGVEERCCDRSMAYPGLMNLWLGWAALPGRRTAILGVVAMVTSCCAVIEVEGVSSCGR